MIREKIHNHAIKQILKIKVQTKSVVHPYAWLKHTLMHIYTIQYKKLTDLYPHKLIS